MTMSTNNIWKKIRNGALAVLRFVITVVYGACATYVMSCGFIPFMATLIGTTVGLTGDTTIVSALMTCVIPTGMVAAVAAFAVIKTTSGVWNWVGRVSRDSAEKENENA